MRLDARLSARAKVRVDGRVVGQATAVADAPLVRAGLATVEVAAGTWSRALASADVGGDDLGVVTPDVLAATARDLCVHGEAAWVLRLGRQRARLPTR